MNILEFLYNSGDAFLPDPIKKILYFNIIGDSKKTFYISGWSIIHFISGIIFGFFYLHFNFNISMYYIYLFILHSFWELWQTIIGMAHPFKIIGGGNIVDIIIDTFLFMSGAFLWKYLKAF
jgi:hypothetical protein